MTESNAFRKLFFFQNHSFCDFYKHKLLKHLLDLFTYHMKILTQSFINIKMAAVVLEENWFMFDDLTELIKTGKRFLTLCLIW